MEGQALGRGARLLLLLHLPLLLLFLQDPVLLPYLPPLLLQQLRVLLQPQRLLHGAHYHSLHLLQLLGC
jgi:hypothetical protein